MSLRNIEAGGHELGHVPFSELVFELRVGLVLVLRAVQLAIGNLQGVDEWRRCTI